MHLSSLSAAALAAALVAAVAVLAFSQLPELFVWAAFVGWASYDHSGGTAQAAIRSSTALVSGVTTAWLVAIVVAARLLPLNTPAATATAAGTTQRGTSNLLWLRLDLRVSQSLRWSVPV
jgi:hypothetical protein